MGENLILIVRNLGMIIIFAILALGAGCQPKTGSAPEIVIEATPVPSTTTPNPEPISSPTPIVFSGENNFTALE